MKNRYIIVLLFFSGLLCYGSSCKKQPDVTPQAEIDKLPPATQTGENTIGALVNGKALIPYSSSYLESSHHANYIYTNGGYYFLVTVSNSSDPNYLYSLTLSTNMQSIREGQNIKLENNHSPGKACGLYGYLFGTSSIDYETTTTVNGQLYISKLDTIKQIVSGTFFFNAINLTKGDTIRVTDGRFDMRYTL